MNINEIMSRAMFFYNNEDFEKTLNFLNKILTEDPNNSEAKEFLTKVKKRISLEPYINHFLEYAAKLYNEGRFKEAIEQAEKAVSTDPESNKAKLFLDKLKNEADHSSGIEPFSEDSFAEEITAPEAESSFMFGQDEADDTAAGDSEQVVEQDSMFDQPFQFNIPSPETGQESLQADDMQDEPQYASQDDFTFSIESDSDGSKQDEEEAPSSSGPIIADDKEPPEPSSRKQKAEENKPPVFEFPDIPAGQDKTADTQQEEDFPAPEETADAAENHLSHEDFDFAEDKAPLPQDDPFSMPQTDKQDSNKPEGAKGETEKDIFDFEVATNDQAGQQKADMNIEEAEIGFFTQKGQSAPAPESSSVHTSKVKLQSSEGLLNEFQRGLAVYKELNLKEALDIFTKILSYEKDFKNELPDLFEESKQLFLEIKSKLKDDSPEEEPDFAEPETDSFGDMMIKTQISIKKGSQFSKVKTYTIASIVILAVILLTFIYLKSTSKSKDASGTSSTNSDVDFSHTLIQQQRAEQIENLLNQANLLFSQGKEKEAQELLDELFELDPENRKAKEIRNRILLEDYLIKGQSAYDVHNFKDAYENFQKAYDINPNIPDLKQKLDLSRESYQNNEALYSRMNSYFEIKEKGDLNKTYRTLKAIKNDYPDSKFVNIEFEQISKQKQLLDDKVKLEKIEEHMGAARFHFNNGLYELAISEYRKALEIDPGNEIIQDMLYKSFYNTGIDALKRRDGRTAYWAFNESLKILPDDEESKKLAEFAFKNLEKVTTPNYSDYVNSLGKKE